MEKGPMTEAARFGWFLVAVLNLKHDAFSTLKGKKFMNRKSNNWFFLIAGLRYVN